jgi:hypothetical protein
MRPKQTMRLLRMTTLLPQLRCMMITPQSQPIHMLLHLRLHLRLLMHRLPPKHCLLTLAMVLSPYPLLALQPKNVIYR